MASHHTNSDLRPCAIVSTPLILGSLIDALIVQYDLDRWTTAKCVLFVEQSREMAAQISALNASSCSGTLMALSRSSA